MTSSQKIGLGRRNFLQAISGSVFGTAAIAHLGKATAQDAPDGSDTVSADKPASIGVVDPPATANNYGTTPGIQKIAKDPDAGFHSPYFLYTPRTPSPDEISLNDSQTRPLLVTVVPWGDYQNRVENARQEAQGGLLRTVADRTNSPFLVAPLWFRLEPGLMLGSESEPSGPRRERVDLQLLAMIEDAKSRLEGDLFSIADQIHFEGASLAGRFIDRVAALHPEQVNLFSSGANGIAFLPLETATSDTPTHNNDDVGESITWPFGTANFESLVGKEFNKDAWMNITQFRWIGENDQDRENPDDYVHKPYRGYWEGSQLVENIFGTFQVDHRFETTKEIYNHLGVPATFTIFEGAGHTPERPGRRKIIDFHEKAIRNEFLPNVDLNEIAVQGATLTDDGTRELTTGQQMIYTAVFKNLRTVPENVTVTLTIDGTDIERVTKELPPEQTMRIPLAHTFTEPGTYTVQINGHEPKPRPLTVVPAETPTPTPVPTPSPTPTPGPDTPTETDTATPTTDETPGDSGPGFGIGAALTGVAATGYMLIQSNNDSD